MSLEDLKIQWSIYLANVFGTHSSLASSLWGKLSQEQIKNVQYNLYERAYNIIDKIIDGDKDYRYMATYMYGHELVVRHGAGVSSSIEAMIEILPNICKAIAHRAKHLDGKVIVPPAMEESLISKFPHVRARAIEQLSKFGIDPAEHEREFIARKMEATEKFCDVSGLSPDMYVEQMRRRILRGR